MGRLFTGGTSVTEFAAKRVCSSSHIDRFPGLINDVRNANVHERMLDRLVAQPARLAREVSRKAVKALAMRLLGRDGMTRAKLIWASWRVWNGPQFWTTLRCSYTASGETSGMSGFGRRRWSAEQRASFTGSSTSIR